MKNLKRLVSMLMVIMMIITFSFSSISDAAMVGENSTSTYNISVSGSNGMEYRTIANLNLRDGNSTDHSSIVIMPKGSYVKHLGTTDNGWFKLDYKGKIGYAHRNYVTSKANYDKNYDDKNSNDIVVSQSNGMEYRTIKNLDLRAGNSDSHKSVIVMTKGSYVKHLGTADNGWFKLDYKGKIGYAHRGDVTSKANYDKNYNDKNSNDIVVSESNGNIYRTIANLNLREGNSTSHSSITVMPKGSNVKHLGTADNGWFKLDYSGKIGYAHRDYVTSQTNYDKNYGDKSPDDSNFDDIKVGKPNGREYITIRDLDLRKGNSDSHDSIIVMAKGSYVKHLGTTDNDWFKLDYNGTVGFAHRSQVTAPKPEVKPEPKKPIVFLDYGHGGSDPGASGPSGRREKDDALRVGLLVAKELRNNGVKVDQSRTTDRYLELWDRTGMANKKDYDYFVSIHRNAFNKKAYGVETYSHANSSRKSKDLSSVVQRNLVGVGFYNRGAKHKDLYVLRNTNAPAILLEVGFVDNEGDNKIFDNNINKIAKAISNGILSELARNK